MTNSYTLRRITSALTAFVVVASLFIGVVPASAAEEMEDTSTINFTGQLIELSSTSVPTTIIVREDPAGTFTDYTVDINESTEFGTKNANITSMDDWMPGDLLTIKGTLNENTGVVAAISVVNQSMNPKNYRGLNGWIDSLDLDASQMVVQWNGELHTVNVTDNSHMVVPPANPAALSDFQVGDRVRLRLIKNSEIENEARIILILRRGPKIYSLARTRGFNAQISELDVDSDTMNVTLRVNPHLEDGDVNNLVGVEGDTVTVTWDSHTKFVRKYFGSTDEDELSPGDNVFIVGRVDDSGIVEARLIKDSSIFKLGVATHPGKITAIDTENKTMTVLGLKSEGEWTVSYDSETTIWVNGVESTVDALEVDDVIRARGTANRVLKTIDADTVYQRDGSALEAHKARLSEILDDVAEYEDEQDAESLEVESEVDDTIDDSE